MACPYTHQQQGTVERRHRHIVETTLALLAVSSVPQQHWDFMTVSFFINLLPTLVLNHISPVKKLFHRPQDYKFLRVFGCACWPNLLPYNRHKMDFRSKMCVFLGYSPQHLGYKCLHVPTRRLYVARNVVFDEEKFPFAASSQISATQVPTVLPLVLPQNICVREATSELPCPSSNTVKSAGGSSLPRETSSAIARPIVVSRPEVSYDPCSITRATATCPTVCEPPTRPEASLVPDTCPILAEPHDPSPHPHAMKIQSKNNTTKPTRKYADFFTSDSKHPLIAAIEPGDKEPTCYSEAARFPQWRTSMNLEFTALMHNGTWNLVHPHSTMNLVECKWVFKIKRKSDGSIDRYKARLVAKEFHQQPSIDFDETYSQVVKPTTIRMVLSLAVTHNWPIRQLDVQNAFLRGNLEENVYMSQPPGFVHPLYLNHVCHLQQALYELKQAPRAWFSRLSFTLCKMEFIRSQANISLSIYRINKDEFIFILIYVDDI